MVLLTRAIQVLAVHSLLEVLPVQDVVPVLTEPPVVGFKEVSAEGLMA
jgi:hypothetical protein